MQLRELFAKSNSTAVLAFGRMNPPTIGHKKLAEKILSLPGDPFIFLSHTQKKQTDPLDFATKVKFVESFFPSITVGDSSVRTVIQAMQKLESLGYKNVTFVAGDDRVESFRNLLTSYNNKEYFFETIKVVSAGARDPDSDGVEGISASKLRLAAASNNFEDFKKGVPNEALAESLYHMVRKGMQIKEGKDVESDLLSAFEDFLPLVMKELKLSNLPPIKLAKYIDNPDQPTFGRFDNEEKVVHLGIEDRHPIDILRTLAHELVHYKQQLENKLDKDSGETGSTIENEAHAKAGVIMRHFNKKFPKYFKTSDVDLEKEAAHG